MHAPKKQMRASPVPAKFEADAGRHLSGEVRPSMERSRLVLGTVQFGQTYGIANVHGKPSFETVCEIVKTAYEGGIRTLDTAAAYGDSEIVLGRALTRLGLRDKLSVVSKIPPIEGETDAQAAAFIADTITASLKRLGVDRLSACLLHRETDIRFLPLLEDRVGRGLIGEAGVSLDTARYLREGAAARCVQVPCNILDRRFDSLWPLTMAHGTRVFTRSVYLQGLMLMPENAIPPNLSAVVPVRRALATLAIEAGLSLAELCMRFVLSNPAISGVLVGVDTAEQLRENLRAAAAGSLPNDLLAHVNAAVPAFPEAIVRPALWR